MGDHYADLREREDDRREAAKAKATPVAPTQFNIGQPVEADMGVHYDEWRGVPLWIAALTAEIGTGKVTYTVSESWPPSKYSHLTDLWEQDELIVRTIPASGGAA